VCVCVCDGVWCSGSMPQSSEAYVEYSGYSGRLKSALEDYQVRNNSRPCKLFSIQQCRIDFLCNTKQECHRISGG